MPPTPSLAQRRRAAALLEQLKRAYPDAHCELDFRTPLELAVAAILAAQCTDKRVNLVTPALFVRYPTAAAYAQADPTELEEAVRTTGFFRNKARHIRALGQALVEQYGGELPRDLDALIALPGIGRKTANLLLADAFGQPGMIVDTHQLRVNRLLGLTSHDDAERVEADLRGLIPESEWTFWSHSITIHGRYCCVARARRTVRNVRWPNSARPGAEYRAAAPGRAPSLTIPMNPVALSVTPACGGAARPWTIVCLV
jgi:endonuclease-3